MSTTLRAPSFPNLSETGRKAHRFLTSRRAKRIGFVAAVFAGMNLFAAGWQHVVLTMTPSVKAKVLVRTPDKAPVIGDYVLLEAHHDYLPDKVNLLTKRYLCGAGQHLEASGKNVTCDGVWLHRRKEETGTGEPLEAFIWSGTIPEGMVYVGSKHPDGFDSRYLGFFPYEGLTRLKAIL
jgi:type IV secretory pathway protease TraF